MLPTAAQVAAKKAKRQRTNHLNRPRSRSSRQPEAVAHHLSPARPTILRGRACLVTPSRMPSAAEVPSAAQPTATIAAAAAATTAATATTAADGAIPAVHATTSATTASAAPPRRRIRACSSSAAKHDPGLSTAAGQLVLRSIRNVPWQFAAETASRLRPVRLHVRTPPLPSPRSPSRPVLGQSATPAPGHASLLGHAPPPRPRSLDSFSLGLVLSHSPLAGRRTGVRSSSLCATTYSIPTTSLAGCANSPTAATRSGIPHAHAQPRPWPRAAPYPHPHPHLTLTQARAPSSALTMPRARARRHALGDAP